MGPRSAGWLFAAVLLASAWYASAQYDYQWHTGRATHYGSDAWSIHKGSCGFGYIPQDEPAGWDVVALSDRFPQFSGSCGRCYEIKCNPATVRDGYGKQFDRTHVCRDPSKSLLVRVVDACPCTYAANPYSNKRWCCGDMAHMDVSVWAFEKLAEKKWGVIGIQFRAVPCSYQPPDPAPEIPSPTPGDHRQAKDPSFIETGDLKIPKHWSPQQGPLVVQGWQFGDPTGSSSDPQRSSSAHADASAGSASASASASSASAGSSASATSSASASSSSSAFSSATASAFASAGGSAGTSQALAEALGMLGVHSLEGPAPPEPGQPGASSSQAGDAGIIFLNGLQNGWSDASYSARVDWRAGLRGADGGGVVCADVKPGGALAARHDPGAFAGVTGLEWRMQTDGKRPAFSFSIGTKSKTCSAVALVSMGVQDTRGGWSRFSMHLGDFGGSYSHFQGCGGVRVADLTTLTFKNTGGKSQRLCLDSVHLFTKAGSS